ncbi:hypothetical protein OIU76_023686 [Salix suchowensis]|nr:hypothetical protein OIU76_023686 [Salix suchowensis]
MEEKGFGYERMDSLEEKVSVFFHGDLSDESDLCLEEEDDDDGPDNSLHDPMERALYWESQEALLQVFSFYYNNLTQNLQ